MAFSRLLSSTVLMIDAPQQPFSATATRTSSANPSKATLALRVLTRLAALLVITQAMVWVPSLLMAEAELDALGTGLLAFAGVALIALVWGGADGARHGIVHACLVWVFTALTFGITSSGLTLMTDGPGYWSAGEILTQMAILTPVLVGTVLPTGVLGAAIGGAIMPHPHTV